MKKIKCTPLWMAYAGVLVALQVVLGNLVQVALLTKQMNFGFLPVAAAGYLLGPIGGLVVGALGDVLGTLLFGTGAYFPGFTVSAALVGFLYGWLLSPDCQKWLTRIVPKFNYELLIRAMLASLLVAAVYIFLNSYWLTFIVSKGYWALLIGRLPFNLAEAPIFALLITAACAALDRLPPSLLPMRAKPADEQGRKEA